MHHHQRHPRQPVHHAPHFRDPRHCHQDQQGHHFRAYSRHYRQHKCGAIPMGRRQDRMVDGTPVVLARRRR
jgi:hypothetical protein